MEYTNDQRIFQEVKTASDLLLDQKATFRSIISEETIKTAALKTNVTMGSVRYS